MVKLFCVSAATLALAMCASTSIMPSVDASIVSWNRAQELVDQIPRRLLTQVNTSDTVNLNTASLDTASLDKKLEAYIREGRFPKAGRSLEAKIREAQAFLKRETSAGAAGVGVAAAVVYKDKVVLSKGYGLRNVSDSTSSVTSSTLFQIGSVTKTFVALAIAVLVDEGKLAWHDPVIKHLPTLKLFDKYAEQHVTIGDLLAMNSGLGRTQDLGWVFGLYPTDRDFVAALGDAQPEHTLRSEYDYANANFAILGQLIEHVSGLEWDTFIKQRIWEPLGMKRTFGDASSARGETDKTAGHTTCGKEVLGPFDLVSSPEVELVTGVAGGKIAAGSMLSSADDMTKFLRLMLNKGSVNGVKILRSPSLVTEMVSGKSIVGGEMARSFSMAGHHFVPEGNTLAAGYGVDAISHALWGHAYFDKGGDTPAHKTRTGFIPDDEQLGVMLLTNSQFATARESLHIDHMRSYLVGIFLDVPTDLLELSLKKWSVAVPSPPTQPGVPACGASFWKNPPDLPLNASEAQAVAGAYVPEHSSKFFGSINVTATSANRLQVRAGKLMGSLQLVQELEGAKLFLFVNPSGQSLIPFTKDPATGKYSISMGLTFQQQ